MTCIVAIIDKESKTIYMGGDSAGVGGCGLTIRKDPKVFKNKGFIFGFTSSFRMGQILAHGWAPPDKMPEVDIYEYMVTTFVDSVRNRFKSCGFNQTKDGVESGGNFLVGVDGRVFEIGKDYQVGESEANYAACGCGEDIANGALAVLTAVANMGGREAAKQALEAAERHSAGVRGPFIILEQKFGKQK